MEIVISTGSEVMNERLCEQIRRCFPEANIQCFSDALFAIQYIYGRTVDIVVTETRMKRPMTAERFVDMVKKRNPNTQVVVLLSEDGSVLSMNGAYWVTQGQLALVLGAVKRRLVPEAEEENCK